VGDALKRNVRLLLSMNDTVIVEYLPKYGRELVQMWRDSFEQAVGIQDPHTLEEQLRFVEQELIRSHSVVIVLEKGGGKVVGFLAATAEKISQLYVHVDHQNKGIGSMLVNLAKQNSNGRLRLFTFECNKNAQHFYENHGFKIVARGFEKNWQLADIEYEWNAATSATEHALAADSS
jgi:ribosomal protein S18 acetylase RimI-like enzyme